MQQIVPQVAVTNAFGMRSSPCCCCQLLGGLVGPAINWRVPFMITQAKLHFEAASHASSLQQRMQHGLLTSSPYSATATAAAAAAAASC
jgi:hypothetical protein